MYPRYIDTCDNGFRDGWIETWFGNVDELFVLEGSAQR